MQKSFTPNSSVSGSLLTILFAALVTGPHAAHAAPPPVSSQAAATAALDAEPNELVEFLAKSGFKTEEITPKLKPLLARTAGIAKRKSSYHALEQYYRRTLGAFAELYPAGIIAPAPSKALSDFKGNLRLTSYDVHYLPFLPLVPEAAFSLDHLRLVKLSAEFKGKTIHGLRFIAPLPYEQFRPALDVRRPFMLTMSYIATINARVMGFTHAQLISALSPRVQPAPKFEYNGARDWSEHSRYRAIDQLSRPIELTNIAHQSGDTYQISSHPDFALTGVLNAFEPITMTFFLWRSEGGIFGYGRSAPSAEHPDFVLQVQLLRPKVPQVR